MELNDIVKAEVTRWYRLFMAGKLVCNEEQMQRLLSIMAHEAVSHDVVVNEILHVSPSTFSDWMAKGKMPKGRSIRGWKELAWYRDEILVAKAKMKEGKMVKGTCGRTAGNGG